MKEEIISAHALKTALIQGDIVSVGMNIKLMRNLMSMQSQEAAELLGVEKAYISKLEAGYFKKDLSKNFYKGYDNFIKYFKKWLANELVRAENRACDAQNYVSVLQLLSSKMEKSNE